jgi:hypothetical protein
MSTLLLTLSLLPFVPSFCILDDPLHKSYSKFRESRVMGEYTNPMPDVRLSWRCFESALPSASMLYT